MDISNSFFNAILRINPVPETTDPNAHGFTRKPNVTIAVIKDIYHMNSHKNPIGDEKENKNKWRRI
jgi:hypothetical protein